MKALLAQPPRKQQPFTDDDGEYVLDMVQDEGISVTRACKRIGHYPSAFTRWVSKGGDTRTEHYARAREIRQSAVFDEIEDIADDSSNDWLEIETKNGSKTVFNQEHFQRARLRIDARKWALARMNPKK
ncbi:MAG: terminase small subunit protein [Pseudomonadota bacterium]